MTDRYVGSDSSNLKDQFYDLCDSLIDGLTINHKRINNYDNISATYVDSKSAEVFILADPCLEFKSLRHTLTNWDDILKELDKIAESECFSFAYKKKIYNRIKEGINQEITWWRNNWLKSHTDRISLELTEINEKQCKENAANSKRAYTSMGRLGACKKRLIILSELVAAGELEKAQEMVKNLKDKKAI